MSLESSAIYAGWLTHVRTTERVHRLRYRMFQILLDLDETSELHRRLTLFSVNRFNVFSHHDSDHGEGRPAALKAWVEDTLAEAGIALNGGRILMLAVPRLLGKVFNPLSIYYCHRVDGVLAAMIYEVNNTFGERHAYVIPAGTETGEIIRQSCVKTFRVSPFLDMGMTYDFAMSRPGQTLLTRVTGRSVSGERIIDAAFRGQRRELTDRALLGLFIGFPLMSIKIVCAIRWEALRLWLKGVKLRPTSPPSASSVTVVDG